MMVGLLPYTLTNVYEWLIIFLRTTPPGPEVTFLDEPYQVLEETITLEVCFNVTRNGYEGGLNYSFVGISAQGILYSEILWQFFIASFPIISWGGLCWWYD